MGMYRRHRESMKAYIERLEESHRALEIEREVLWAGLRRVVEAGAVPAPILPEIAGVLERHARCSCGHHASLWCGGKGPKVCEVCMSS